MPKISVIVPAHNEEKYLAKTLQSLREQNFLDYETVIVCNGCTDQTQKIARDFLNQSTQILSLEKPQVSLARNLGAHHSTGELLLFLDADTLLEPASLKTISENFTEDVSVATTLSQPDTKKLSHHLVLALKNFFNQTKLYQGCSGALICRKNDFHQVGEYPELAVKEQRKLIIKLKKLKGYKVISTKAITSMRRFERWGTAKVLSYWLRQWLKNYFSDLKKEEYEKVR